MPPVAVAQEPGPSVGLAGFVPDVPLIDQEGRKVRFYSDVIRGRQFAINFVYTSCKRFCPLQARLFADLRKQLPRDIDLISISLDPVTDTPARLKEWQSRVGASEGWSLFTGRPEDVDQLVVALTGDIARPTVHRPFLLAGSDPAARLFRGNGLGEVVAVRDWVLTSVRRDGVPARD